MKMYIIFGTGNVGIEAYEKYKENTGYFIDNDPSRIGKRICGLPVKPVESVLDEKREYRVVIASTLYHNEMEAQLLGMGISAYEKYGVYKKKYGGSDKLVCNPYENIQRIGASSELEWNEKIRSDIIKEKINAKVEEIYGKRQLFDHIEIETVNRCNGGCSFCPVSVKNEKREYCEMSWDLFEKIIRELAEIHYKGELALYSNNEPFLDIDLIEKQKYVREMLPDAYLFLFTNGTLLTLSKFIRIIEYLDELVIDNYNQQLNLIKPCQDIVEYSKTHPEIAEKVTIVLRKPEEILTSRGGDAPNRTLLKTYEGYRCLLPFKQMIVRPDGKVSLCCNDPLGKNTLGDLQKDSVVDVWYNDRFKMVRKCLYEGRENWMHCKYCDTFYLV